MIEGTAGETRYAYLGKAPTGLAGTLVISIEKVDGTVISAETAVGISEFKAGNYRAELLLPATDGDYVAIWRDPAGASPDVYATEDIRVGATEDSISDKLSGTVTVVSPVANSGDLTLVRADDYYNADGRALEWLTDDAATWPDLTGATIAFAARPGTGGAATITKAGSVIQATGANKKVRVELATGDTDEPAGNYSFDVQATLASGRKVTLQRGTLALLEDVAT